MIILSVCLLWRVRAPLVGLPHGVTTTIDRHAQQIAIAAMRRQLSGLGAERVRDGAVVVLDNATGDVLAYVGGVGLNRSEEHTSELQSLMRISYAVFCLKKNDLDTMTRAHKTADTATMHNT